MRAYHPLLGRPSPTFESLRARAEPDAQRAFDAARSLAQARITHETELLGALAAAQADPWIGPRRQLRGTAKAVLAVDVLRALVATAPERMSALLPNGPFAGFGDVVDQWRNLAQAAPRGELPLAPAYARRFALADRRGERTAGGTRPAVTLSYVLGSVQFRGIEEGLVPLDGGYAEGLRTQGEVFQRCVDHADLGLGTVPWFEDVPPAYLDRNDDCSRLDRALAGAPGAILSGPPGSGRTALCEAWARRASFRDGKGDFFVRVNPFNALWEGNEAFWEDVGANFVLALTPKDVADERWWSLGARLALRLGTLAAEPGSRRRVIVVASDEELPRLQALAPIVSRFARVAMPRLEEADRVALWLCHAVDRPAVSLGTVYSVLWALAPDQVASLEPWALTSGGPLSPPWWSFEPSCADDLRAPLWLKSAIDRLRAGVPDWDAGLRGARRDFVARWVGTRERLRALEELEQELRS